MRSSLRRHGTLALSAAVVLAALTACTQEDEPTPASATDPASSSSPAPSEPESTSPGEQGSTPGESPSGTAVPVYYVADAPQGPRLFREFHRVDGDPLTEVAALVDGGSPLDPDYRTLWPGGTVEGAVASDGLLVVQLEGDAFTERPDGMSRRDARLALQQMVYSLQGAFQERVPVQFVREGGAPARLFGLDVAEPVRQASALGVLGLANVTTPAQGDAVTGGTLEASGVANSFEATVVWEVRRGEEVVLDGFTTAEGWMAEKLFPWEASIDVSSLEPGDYTFAARTDDPAGGEEGFGPTEDTKDFTIR